MAPGWVGPEQLAQPPKASHVEVPGGHVRRTGHGADELSTARDRPQRRVAGRRCRLQAFKVKGFVVPGDGPAQVAHRSAPAFLSGVQYSVLVLGPTRAWGRNVSRRL